MSKSPTKNNEQKGGNKSKPYTSRNSPEPEKQNNSPNKALNENRKVTPYVRQSEVSGNNESNKHKLPNYINMSSHLKENE